MRAIALEIGSFPDGADEFRREMQLWRTRKAILVAHLYTIDPAAGQMWALGPRTKERLVNYILNTEYDRD